jgi:hypothetical protein
VLDAPLLLPLPLPMLMLMIPLLVLVDDDLTIRYASIYKVVTI